MPGPQWSVFHDQLTLTWRTATFCLKRFSLLNGVFRYGNKFDPHAELGPIDLRNHELPFAMDVEMTKVSRASKDEVEAEFLRALVPALFSISIEFDLPADGLMGFAKSKGFSVSREAT